MKKIILSFVFSVFAIAAYSQKTVDWSIDQVIAPTQINSSATGTKITYDVVLKNLGPDSVKTGDTLWFLYGITTTTGTAVILAPGPNLSTYFTRPMTKNMKTGDTMHLVGSGQSSLNIYPSANMKFFMYSHVTNRPRGVKFEGSSSNANNQKITDCIWYNIQGWPVSAKTPSTTNASIFPNVANNSVTLTLPIVNQMQPVNIAMYDLMGKLVQTNSLEAAASSYNVSTTNLPNGTYVVQVSNGDLKSTVKLIVQH
jgi:hypothetical protein